MGAAASIPAGSGRRPALIPPDVTSTRHNALVVAIEIRPRDSSFAKTCPQRVQLDVLQPCEPLPDPPFLQMLYRAGNEHEDDTFAALFDGVEGAVVIDAEDLDAREWQTMQAVKAGALGHRRRSAPGRPRGASSRSARPARAAR